MAAERESNIELLRIVSMLMVVLVHIDGASLGLPQALTVAATARDVWQLAVEALVIIGVNCFTLISGYFGIRLRVRTALGYLFQCLFYAVAMATLAWIIRPDKVGADIWLQSWMVLTHTDLWYVPAYFLLMLLSPLINAGLEGIGRRGTFLVTGLFLAYTMWAGWWWGGTFNANGYTPLQLVLVYMMGRCLHLLPRPSARHAWLWAGVYLASAVAVCLSTAFLDSIRAYAYNSPLVLMESVAMFMAFSAMRFRSRAVNHAAKSAFAVYLVHKSQLVFGSIFKPLMLKCWGAMSLGSFTGFMLLFAVGIYLALMPADWVRRRVWLGLLKLKAERREKPPVRPKSLS